MNYAAALVSLTAFARADDNIRALVLTGSAAAAGARPLSDRDVELHARDTAILEDDEGWWRALGTVLVFEKLENGQGQPTRIVHYVGGKLDFTLIGVGTTNGVYDRPFRVLLDKDGEAAAFRHVHGSPAAPDQGQFDECVNRGYAAALMQARAIARDEPWSTKIRDTDLKAELLRMIEWDHAIRYGAARDTRHLGAGMREWMDLDIQKRLTACWARFDLADGRRATDASVDLFADLATRVAGAAQLADFDQGAVRAEIITILGSS